MMVNSSENSRKKIILISVLIGVTLLFLLFTYFIIKPDGNDSSKDLTPVRNEALPSTDDRPASELKTYKNSLFSINYPNDWQIDPLQTPVEQGVVIRPAVSSSAAALVIATQRINSNPTIKQKQEIFGSLGFTKSELKIDGIPAETIRGTIPPKNAPKSENGKILQVAHTYFDKGDTSFLLKYTYIGTEVDALLENTFFRIISSFRFTK